MKPPKASLLLHPLFVFSLAVLLTNDFYWKPEYHNWLTGKLSDFAGLIVLPVFLRVVFPRISQITLFLFCSAFFLWWKSPLSQSFLDWLNASLHLPVQRVIDYSDWLALLVLPLAVQLGPKTFPLHTIAAYCLRCLLGAIAFFSLCATSMPYRSLFMAHPDSKDIYFAESFTQKHSPADILQTLAKKGISYRIDSVMYYPVLNQRSLYYRLPSGKDSSGSWQQISQDTTLYIKREGEPYFLIPFYQSGSQAFRNIRFALSENKSRTKTKVVIETFQADSVRPYDWMDRKKRNAYKEIFENLFSE